MKTELQSSIENFLQNLDTEIDVLSLIDVDNIDHKYAFDSIYDMICDNNGFDFDVIYYSKALDYLRENDPSLKESLSIAQELGFTVDDLNSELLASLLISENVKDEFCKLEDEINNFFEELEEEE